MPLQQQPRSFPAASRLPAGVLDAHLLAQDLLSCDLPWVEQALEKILPQLGLAAPARPDLRRPTLARWWRRKEVSFHQKEHP